MSHDDRFHASHGYHVTTIPRGEYGSVSKIVEEALEAADAVSQGARIMLLCELADIIGAVHGVLEQEFPDTTMTDLIVMADITRRAFENGDR